VRKASRLFEIIQILRLAKRPVTAAQIAGRLGVVPRSIYRDIAALQSMRVPIEGGRGIGYILRAGFNLPPLMFSVEEMEAIVLALALLDRAGRRGTEAGGETRESEDSVRGAPASASDTRSQRPPCVGDSGSIARGESISPR
jgi:predicted DNA-binding transcriptional regulator YafY